jgi:hypothetical protein
MRSRDSYVAQAIHASEIEDNDEQDAYPKGKKRVDHHNESLARGERHICDFTPQRGIETFFRDGTRVNPQDAWEPISTFLATTNTPITLGESPVLRDLLRDFFEHGFHAGATNP